MRSLVFLLGSLAVSLPAAAQTSAALWVFDVALGDNEATLTVRACSARAQPSLLFRADRRAGEFLVSARRSSGAALELSGNTLAASDWLADECLLTQIDTTAAAAADPRGQARRNGHFLRLPASRWLWRPRQLDPDSQIRFQLPDRWSTSVPWLPLPDGSYRMGSTPERWPALTAFGRFTEHTVALAGGRLRISVLPSADSIDESSIVHWLSDVGAQLARLSGRLPRADTQVLVYPLPGVDDAVPWGEITRGGGSSVHLYLGLEAGVQSWRADWTAQHEFAHLLHPFLGDAGRWLSEGLASYYQTVMRARSGEFSPAYAWSRLRQGLQRGRRASRDDARTLQQVSSTRARGSTMRVYWVGAAYWLESDRALRQSGDSLDALLSRFARRHTGVDCCWTPETFIQALDALAPEADLLSRFSRYARSKEFPLGTQTLEDWSLELEKPGSVMAAILAQRPAAEIRRRESP